MIQKIVYSILLAGLTFGFFAQAEVSCECPKLKCDSCSIEQGVKFYSEKCGVENSKVRSCSRPSCSPISEPTRDCPVPPLADSGLRAPVEVKAAAGVPQVSAVESKEPEVGRVKVIKGEVAIVRADGQKSVVSQEVELSETDRIEASPSGQALVTFTGGNKLHVHNNTVVQVKEFKNPQVPDTRRTLLHLIRGKIRNQVEQKYNGKTSYYKIETKSAVAGVRGTDFVIEQTEKESALTSLQTLKGKVELTGTEGTETREISTGEGITVSQGILSDVYKLTRAQMKDLELNSRVDQARRSSPKESSICASPKGQFDQCAWTCKNPGQGKCEDCVRQRCNGNGVWAEQTQVSEGSARVQCPAKGSIVKACDY